MRIALLTEIPAPYRIPQWNALAAAEGCELRVLLLAEHDPRRSYDVDRRDWRFGACVLPGPGVRLGLRWVVFSRGVRRELDRFSPTAIVVGGWNQPAYLQAASYGRRRGIPVICWVESTMRDVRPGNVLLERVKRRLLASVDGVLVPGEAAVDYVRALGVGGRPVVVAPNAVDPAFTAKVDAAHARREQVRRELGVSGCCFLSVSRLSPEKGVDILAAAFAGVPGRLVVAGDGPEEAAVRRRAPSNVQLLGRLRSDDLIRWYAAADAFALASRSETWGMALHEAAAAGLPLVASEAVGAAYDLIEPGENGFRVPVGDTEALRRTLTTVASDAAFRERAAQRSRQLGRRATPQQFASALSSLARDLNSR